MQVKAIIKASISIYGKSQKEFPPEIMLPMVSSFKEVNFLKKLIDDGWIGKPIAANAFMMGHGHENWHPDPEFYYEKGGGPMFDMGPYYLTSLIKIFGNVEKVISYSQKTFDKRKVENPDVDYSEIKVDIDTHYFALLKFESDIVVDFQVSSQIRGIES